ncbi:MAG: hypothetical protein C4576_23315 [Desulfobacteraceae bacterium]|nr:MAG: hypothetical protein C4576_23315 [Desulfobacteraceae bacterium]
MRKRLNRKRRSAGFFIALVVAGLFATMGGCSSLREPEGKYLLTDEEREGCLPAIDETGKGCLLFEDEGGIYVINEDKLHRVGGRSK